MEHDEEAALQQDNSNPHTAPTTQRALCGVQQLPWPARTPDFSPIEHVWDMMKRELTLSLEPAKTIAEFRQRMQDAWRNILRMSFGSFRTVCMLEYTPAVPSEEGALCFDVTVRAPFTVTFVFHLILICYHILL